MIPRLTIAGLLLLAAAGQGQTIQAWFPDGTGVELNTEVAGSAPQTLVHGGGMIWLGQVSRFVQNSRGENIFGYELDACKSSKAGAVDIRIKRVTNGTATVSATREFLGVTKGQEVRLEILANPTTGEKVYDVLRIAEGVSPSPRSVAVTAVPSATKASASLVVNGQALAVKNTWTAGKPARLSLPGHGVYYLFWESQPKSRLAGYVEKNRLIFLLDSQYVELTCAGNILTTAERGPVWIYHDTEAPSGLPGAELTIANLEAFHAKN